MASFSDYMVQHILYIKGVEKSIAKKTEFAHKHPTECAFGKMFYSTLKPNFDQFGSDKRGLLEDVERTHIQFHESARHIHIENPASEIHQRDAWLHSARLINLLGRLEKMGN
jgi:hypothetical protein